MGAIPSNINQDRQTEMVSLPASIKRNTTFSKYVCQGKYRGRPELTAIFSLIFHLIFSEWRKSQFLPQHQRDFFFPFYTTEPASPAV